MVCGLFSSFDPSVMVNNHVWALKWLTLVSVFFTLSWQCFLNKTKMVGFFSFISSSVFDMVSQSLKKPQEVICLICTLFVTVLMCGWVGLIPYSFTVTSHLSFNVLYSLPLWLAGLVVGLKKSFQEFLAHILPLGSPPALWVFLILVESVSLLIRPLTLSVRLMANMMAGHLVMGLVSNSSLLFLCPVILFQCGMQAFELGVCVIQSFVFCNLMTLYWRESE